MLLISANCYVETILLMNTAGMLLVLGERGSRRDAACSWSLASILGVLAGGAAGVKLTGLSAAVIPCLWYAGQVLFGRRQRFQVLRRWTLYLLVALAVGLPFYLRPWLATGNPFHPFLWSWFSDDPAVVEMSGYHHAISGFAYGVRSLVTYLDGPLLLAFRADNYDGEFGWQLLVIVVLAVMAGVSAIRPRRRAAVVWPSVVTLWLYTFWFLTAQQARFAVPAMLGFVMVAAAGLRLVHGPGRRLVLVSLVLATLISIPWRRHGYYEDSALAASGRISRADYVHNLTDVLYMPLIQALEFCTPPEAHIMLLFEHRGFYIPRRYTIGTPFFQAGPFSPPELYTDGQRVMQELRGRRITHVVMTRVPAGPDHAPGWTERQLLLFGGLGQCVQQGWLEIVWQSESHLLLAVRP